MSTNELIRENKGLRDQLIALSKIHAKDMLRLSNMIDARDSALATIYDRMIGPAGNRRFMQIAGPARECINLAKPFLKHRESNLS